MIRQTLAAAALALPLVSAIAAEPLQLKVINADSGSFHVNATVISGAKEAIVIDSGFTRADAFRIAASVLDTGKTLKTVLISNADPDFYFGSEVLKSIFPNAEIVATPAVLEKIKAKVAGKLAFWGPKMGANAPLKPVMPTALTADSLTIDGETVEIRGTTGLLASRPYVWIPSLRAVAGNLAIFGNVHVWTADTQSKAERQAWIAQLDEIAKLNPAVVVPGHMAPATKLDASAIQYTRDYLVRFEAELDKAANSAALIETMTKAYPNAGLGIALDIGAKVNKGEMKW